MEATQEATMNDAQREAAQLRYYTAVAHVARCILTGEGDASRLPVTLTSERARAAKNTGWRIAHYPRDPENRATWRTLDRLGLASYGEVRS
jgi:hypothetical protein